jgi:outer membrane protein TolC
MCQRHSGLVVGRKTIGICPSILTLGMLMVEIITKLTTEGPPRRDKGRAAALVISLLCLMLIQNSCRSPSEYRKGADGVASAIISEKQTAALGQTQRFDIERPSDILRRRIMVEQNLLHSGEASLGTDQLQRIDRWPEPDYPQAISSGSGQGVPAAPNEPIRLSLIQALQVGARNSFEYQSRKEDVFKAALDLDLQRNDFRNIFTSQVESQLSTDSSGSRTVSGTQTSGSVGLDRKLESSVQLTTALAVDLANLLTMGGASSLGLQADATVSIPLLRGSGRHIVTEPLTQAERNVIYAIWEFERFKRTFAVSVARAYLGVLQQMDEVNNAEENYRMRVAAARQSRRRADAGRVREIEVDQAVQSELAARRRWISAQQQYENRLDAFKSSLDLPPDASIELDRNDLEELRSPALKMVGEILKREASETSQAVPPADSPIELEPPTDEDAGPLEIGESLAVQLALENRLDLRAAIGRVYDGQRQVVVRADALGADLTLLGSADSGARRTVGSATADDAQIRFDKAQYAALLSLNLPLERTAERNAYRKSFIDLERATRDVQTLEDQIKLSIRDQLRALLDSRENLKIQAQAVAVANKRVRSTNLFLEAGRIEIRNLLEAQDALLAAQNSLTAAVITYRTTELELQQDMGLLQVDESGMWQEFSPEVINHVKK